MAGDPMRLVLALAHLRPRAFSRSSVSPRCVKRRPVASAGRCALVAGSLGSLFVQVAGCSVLPLLRT